MRKENPLKVTDCIVSTVESQLKDEELESDEYVRVAFFNSRLPGPVVRILLRERLQRKWVIHMDEYDITTESGVRECGWYMDIRKKEHADI